MKYNQLKLVVLVACSCVASPSLAQISPLNVVGYYYRFLQPGDNLIANQLIQPDNNLNSALVGGVLVGSTFTKWDPINGQYLPLSVFDGSSWSINYNFNPVDGMGGVLHSPGPPTNNVFVGEVYQGHDADHGIDGPLFGVWDGPPRGGGIFLLADQVPIAASFDMVVGRAPQDGEWVRTLNEVNQTYFLTTFHQGSGWDNGVPMLAVGQAAYFSLVPEPSVLTLAALGAAIVLRSRRLV